jgi:Cu-Zn family superoxide dismutase
MRFLFIALFSIAMLFAPSEAFADDLQAKAQIVGPGISGDLVMTEGVNSVVRIRGSIQGNPNTLAPGKHGFHIHAVGLCDANTKPPFSSAGGHFDPGPFGSSTPVEANHPYHLGDVPNVTIDSQGRGRFDFLTSRVTLSRTPLTLFDSDGSAIIVHKLQDQTKAAGTAAEAGGGRLACGVVQKS